VFQAVGDSIFIDTSSVSTFLDLDKNGKTLKNISLSQEAALIKIASSKTIISMSAKTTLEYAKGYRFARPVERTRISDKKDLQVKSTGTKAPSDIQNRTIGNQISLSDNYPNPFNSSSLIDAFIPNNVSVSFVEVHDMVGALVKTYLLTQGVNTISIQANDIGFGIYFYSLFADNKLVATKRMVIVN